MMSEVMTVEEIHNQFPEEWVLIDSPEVDQLQRLQHGKVIFHSPNRAEVDAKSLETPIPRNLAVRFTGKLRPGDVLVI
jgi:hypothetical protein